MNSNSDHNSVLKPSTKEFEHLYVNLRTAENRIYSDEEVAWLPEVAEDHIHKKEWEIRKTSCKKLVRYLRHKRRSLKILEVGCGNGWLSYHLSQIRFSNVTGLDVNLVELQQAQRVFGAIPNLDFIYGDIHSKTLESEKFDIVIFAASIQYFSSLPAAIESVMDRLHNGGEIHLIDSHFYSGSEAAEARQRSVEYFHTKGFDRMDDFYFHHSLDALQDFSYETLYDPNSVMNRFLKKNSPFHWIRIKA